VPDLDRGMAFYRDVLGHQLIWRNEATGQAGLRTPGSDTEIVLTTRQGYEPDWKVDSAEAVAEVFAANGGRVLAGPRAATRPATRRLRPRDIDARCGTECPRSPACRELGPRPNRAQ
jgi:catechol 2,3-dioxygenase-like lactoylglutathione lyase family enzyme